MSELFDINRAKEVVEGGVAQAQELIKDPSKVETLLAQLKEKLQNVPLAGDLLADVPVMIAMVKSYVSREYTEISPKVVASLVSAFIYLVKRKDLIPDSIPLLGYVDDLAVLGVALKLCEPELKAYAAWREGRPTAK